MTSSFVLWMIGTALAASADDPNLVAATDGIRVWLTRDGGATWHPIPVPSVNADADADADADGHEADPTAERASDPYVRALAFLGDRLLIATAEGLLLDGRPLTPLAFEALAVEGATLFGAGEGSLWRSDDGGSAFRLAGALPSPVASLAVSGPHILAAGHDPIVVAVAAAPDGTLFRATPAGVERSHDGRDWRPVAPVAVRALAVGAGDVWLASGFRILRLSEVEVWDRRRLPAVPVRFDPGEVARRAGWAGLLPEVSLLARVAEGLGPGPRERVLGLTFTWSFDDPDEPSIQRTAADRLRGRTP